MDKNIFCALNAVNVNDKTEKKNGLTYLSWAWAWAEFKKVCPDATYEVLKFDGLPYAYDDKTGYIVYTRVTSGGVTHEMWLPVMDSANNAMKAQSYTIKTKHKEIKVNPATMFDVNKTIMRCLTKNLAMFGLGLYIYAGEDLPEDLSREEKWTCSDCGKVIGPDMTAISLKTKQHVSVERHVDAALERYGVPLCEECRQKRTVAAQEEAETA